MKLTIVLTGASSGIGEVTARKLAAAGNNLVLAARDETALQQVADHCRSQGAEVVVVPTDVSVLSDIIRLRDEALAAFGGIDAWVNNAGISQLGSFLKTQPDEFQRVIDVNLHGVVNGSRIALEVFTAQQSGILINVSSILGAVPDPYESAYVTSKFAIRGFTASIRQEIQLSGMERVHVCSVLPSTMDTPIYHNGANRSGKSPLAIPPVYPASLVADAISNLIDDPKDETVVGGAGKVLLVLHQFFPGPVEKIFARYIKKFHFKDEDAAGTPGNLFQESPHHSHSGNWTTVPRYTDKAAAALLVIPIAYALFKFIQKKR